MKVLITGASGFVGNALLAEFSARSIATIAVGGPRSQGCDYSIDISDASTIEILSKERGVDAVIHAAGIAHRFGKVPDNEFCRVNVKGVENVARFAAKLDVRHFVLFSSVLVYGRRSDKRAVTEEDETRPVDAYAESKLSGEIAARNVCEQVGIGLTIFRPAPIIGEGSKGNFARLIRAIDRGRFIWVGRGDNRKSFVYVRDVAKAVAEVVQLGGKGTQVFNLTADAVRMEDIVDTIAEKLGRRVPAFHLPAGPFGAVPKFGPLKRIAATLDTWLSDDVYSNTKLQTTYGFKPSTGLEAAIGREVEYYLKHK